MHSAFGQVSNGNLAARQVNLVKDGLMCSWKPCDIEPDTHYHFY